MADSYHDWDGESLTRSQLYTFRKNPREFYNRYVLGLAQPRSKALVFGSAFHALTLEGRDEFEARTPTAIGDARLMLKSLTP